MLLIQTEKLFIRVLVVTVLLIIVSMAYKAFRLSRWMLKGHLKFFRRPFIDSSFLISISLTFHLLPISQTWYPAL